MNILSIDGGGIRGYFSAQMIKKIEKHFNINSSKYFQMVAGTSTGSIIASALAIGTPIEDVVTMYRKRGDSIFKKRRFHLGGLLKSRYSNENLKKELNGFFGNKTMPETNMPLYITAIDLINASTFVFKPKHTLLPIRKAVLASCSAPTYFRPAVISKKLLKDKEQNKKRWNHDPLFVDGGLWANDPALVAYGEVFQPCQKAKKPIRILSIGTGVDKPYCSIETNDGNWGLLTNWKGPKMVSLMLNMQSQNAQHTLNRIIPSKENYIRINFEECNLHAEIDTPLSECKEYLDEQVEKQFKDSREQLSRFFSKDIEISPTL